MHRMLTRAASAAAFTLSLAAQAASGGPALSEAKLSRLKAQQSARVTTAQNGLLALRGQLGLGTKAGFLSHDAFTNEQGRAVVRFSQTHRGYRVWAGEAIVHVEADGQLNTVTRDLRSGITLEGGPLLTAAQARDIALRDLAPQGPMTLTPKVERVVFPSSATGGLVSRFDPELGREVVDLELSTWAKAPAAPYVWAYEVKTHLMNAQDGLKEYSYIIDGTTGAILRKWDEVQYAAATGTGQSLWSGTVSLATTQSDTDGTYSLVAADRGTTPNPFLQSRLGITQTGLMTMYQAYTMPNGNEVWRIYDGNPTNAWGDGLDFPSTTYCQNASNTLKYFCGALDVNGQTAGVDAHHALVTTWDLYKNVLGRNGIDNAGTSTFAVTHLGGFDFMGRVVRNNNAAWSPQVFGMLHGDGLYPMSPTGFRSMTDIDITGHELTHGVIQSSAGFNAGGETAGLNEGTADIFGVMVRAYARRSAGQDGAIPDFNAGDFASWEIGRGVNRGTPFRWLHKPSLDGSSPDNWFDGMEVLSAHFASGPLRRAFYFLAQGATANEPSSPTYSQFLPDGMTGLGNEKATRIWYKALTEHLTSGANYADARAAAVAAARELYGAGSTEELAVMKAFTAVMVGSLPGEAPRVVVRIPVIHPQGAPLGGTDTAPAGILGKVQIFPTRTSVAPKAVVENSDNTEVTWSLGAPQDGWNGGVINADGTWTTPMWTYGGEFLSIIATSKADPRMYAKARTLVVELDADNDTETDALDLGAIAMAWMLPQVVDSSVHPAGTITIKPDWNLVYFNEAMQAAWPVK